MLTTKATVLTTSKVAKILMGKDKAAIIVIGNVDKEAVMMIRQVMDTDVSEVPQGSQLVKYA